MAKQTFTAGQTLTAAQMTTLQANDFNLTVSTKTSNYTLVASDAGTRVVGNAASLTFTVNNSVFTAGDTLTFDNRDSTVLTIAAGAGVTINSASGLTLAQYQTAQLYCLSASSFVLSPSDVTASAGALVKISGTTLGAVSTLTLDNVFTSTYTNYLFQLNYVGTNSGNDPSVQYRASGATNTSAVYSQMAYFGGASYTRVRNNDTGTAIDLAFLDSGQGTNGAAVAEITFYDPQRAVRTNATYLSTYAQSGGNPTTPVLGAVTHKSATQFDGIKVTWSNTITSGSYALYGYQK
jgi:hypothetical protein